jgi:hypothetical protein
MEESARGSTQFLEDVQECFKLHSSLLEEKATAQTVASDLTSQRRGLDPRPDHVGYVADRVTL